MRAVIIDTPEKEAAVQQEVADQVAAQSGPMSAAAALSDGLATRAEIGLYDADRNLVKRIAVDAKTGELQEPVTVELRQTLALWAPDGFFRIVAYVPERGRRFTVSRLVIW